MILTVIRGDTAIFEVTITDQDGAAVDLTDSTVFFTVKEKQTDVDASALIKKSITVHTDATHGKTTITLSVTETNLARGAYYYDIQVVKSGLVQSTVSDTFRVSQDITTRIA